MNRTLEVDLPDPNADEPDLATCDRGSAATRAGFDAGCDRRSGSARGAGHPRGAPVDPQPKAARRSFRARISRLRWIHRLLPLCLMAGCNWNLSTRDAAEYDYIVDSFEPGTDGRDGAGDGDGAEPPDNDGPDDALLEADIVQLVGDRLYTLSQYGGLAIIDVADPDAMRLLGRYRTHAEPFEMYVEGDVVFIMYRNQGQHVFDDELGFVWRSESSLLALDTGDPGDIGVVGGTQLPGRIQDSRRRDDLLYVVSHQAGCWGCADEPNTTVTSFDISDLTALRQVDQAVFGIDADGYDGQERSVHSTPQRLYIAGPVWGTQDEGSSLVQIVDISDGTGLLALGASFHVEGEISSRWQMDEYQDALRVVSQHPWDQSQAPVIETFGITDSNEVEPLGRAEMTLPRPEQLRSVSFDGPRGYAITFERTDPLFTLDLSDPADPRQVGELEIPGWVYHMVSRGDRLLGLGFDEGNPGGAINVSLFDVADFAAPTLLSRVHFGGDWANFAESQNRIHKAFTVLDDEGLLLVPFSGWQAGPGCTGDYRGGVQLIDFDSETLTARGVAEQDGSPRRALLHDGRLLAVSDTAVQAFDIADRDAPQEQSRIPLSHRVDHIARVGDYVARIGVDWQRDSVVLDVVPASVPDGLEPLGSLDLGEVIEVTGKDGGVVDIPECRGLGLYPEALFAEDRFLYMLRQDHGASAGLALEVFDLGDPRSPTHVTTLELPFALGYAQLPLGVGAGVGGRNAVHAGHYLVLNDSELEWREDRAPVSTASFQVVDLADPADPQLLEPIAREPAMGRGALSVVGDVVISSHARAVDERGAQVAFFIERLDLGGEVPQPLPAVNVPGPAVSYDAASARAIVIAPSFTTRFNVSSDDCYVGPHAVDYDSDLGRCRELHQSLALVEIRGERALLLDELAVEGERGLRDAIGTADTAFVVLGDDTYYGYDVAVAVDPVGQPGRAADAYYPGFYLGRPAELLTVVGVEAGALEIAASTTVHNDSGFYRAAVAGARLVLPAGPNVLAVVDASDPSAPTYELHDLLGTACEGLFVASDTAYCALGQYGAQGISLP